MGELNNILYFCRRKKSNLYYSLKTVKIYEISIY